MAFLRLLIVRVYLIPEDLSPAKQAETDYMVTLETFMYVAVHA